MTKHQTMHMSATYQDHWVAVCYEVVQEHSQVSWMFLYNNEVTEVSLVIGLQSQSNE